MQTAVWTERFKFTVLQPNQIPNFTRHATVLPAMYREMWDKAMNGVHENLVQKSNPSGLTFLADRNGGRLDRKMDHL